MSVNPEARRTPKETPSQVNRNLDIRRESNKYKYMRVLQGDYGHGWEDMAASENAIEVKVDLKAYRENEGGKYRIVMRRELKADQQETSTQLFDLGRLPDSCGWHRQSRGGFRFLVSCRLWPDSIYCFFFFVVVGDRNPPMAPSY